MITSLVNLDFDSVMSLSDAEFFSNFAFYMQTALVKDISLYTDLIDEMYEICEREKSVLEDIILRVEKDRKLILDQNALKESSVSPLSFGFTIAEALSEVIPGKFNNGEYLSLGCVAESYISYKKNWLNKDEYYEIRDMFVPFYLPISVDMLDIENVLTYIKENVLTNEENHYTLALLKKIGRTVVDRTITLDDIKDALEEINFDEAW